MPYTLGEAAKATGKDRATISRAIKKGKISANKNEHGQWSIEPVELHRVYPALAQGNGAQVLRATDNAPTRHTEILLENTELRAKLDAAHERDSLKNQIIEQVKAERDKWQAVAEKQTETVKLLTDQRNTKTRQQRRLRYWLWWGLGLLFILLTGGGLLGYWYWLPG